MNLKLLIVLHRIDIITSNFILHWLLLISITRYMRFIRSWRKIFIYASNPLLHFSINIQLICFFFHILIYVLQWSVYNINVVRPCIWIIFESYLNCIYTWIKHLTRTYSNYATWSWFRLYLDIAWTYLNMVKKTFKIVGNLQNRKIHEFDFCDEFQYLNINLNNCDWSWLLYE